MSIKHLIFFLLLSPIVGQSQDANTSKALKIEFLQALNKLESLFTKDSVQLIDHRDNIIALMDREVVKNNSLTEKLMKTPNRSQAQRDLIQDQLALTAKQKYLKRSFSELDWAGKKLSPQETLDLVRNFMDLIQ